MSKADKEQAIRDLVAECKHKVDRHTMLAILIQGAYNLYPCDEEGLLVIEANKILREEYGK